MKQTIMTATKETSDSHNRKDKNVDPGAGFQKWKLVKFTNNPS